MKEKEGANLIGGGLRRETWIHHGGKRMRRTTAATISTEHRFADTELEDLAQLSSVEVRYAEKNPFNAVMESSSSNNLQTTH